MTTAAGGSAVKFLWKLSLRQSLSRGYSARLEKFRVCMLWPEAEPDDASWYPREHGKPPHHAQEERRFQFAGLAEHALNDVVLDLHLKPLGALRGRFAPFLYTRPITHRHLTCSKRVREDVCRSDRILDCKIDPHTADRRHGVG